MPHLLPILILSGLGERFFPSFWRKHCRFTEDLSLEQKKSCRNLRNRRHKNKMRAFGIIFYLWKVRLNLKLTIIFTWRNHRKKVWRKNWRYSTTRSVDNILIAIWYFYIFLTYLFYFYYYYHFIIKTWDISCSYTVSLKKMLLTVFI